MLIAGRGRRLDVCAAPCSAGRSSSVGGNERAARLSGVPVDRGQAMGLRDQRPVRRESPGSSSSRSIRRATPIWSGSAWSSTRSPRSRSAARRSPAGRRRVVGSLIGALLIQLLRYTLLANGVPDAAALVVKGAIIAGAVWSQQRAKSA